MNTPQNQIIIIIIIIPIYEIFNTRCVNCARCQNCNRRMYIISSMEVLVSLLIICRSLSLHWPGFSSHHFVKGVYWLANKMCWCPYVRTYSKNSQFKFENPIPTPLSPSSRWSLFVHADGYYEMFIHPSNEGSWNNNHWAKVISFLTCGWNIPFYPCTPQIMDVKVAIASKPVG
jgi:hypothetical protein